MPELKKSKKVVSQSLKVILDFYEAYYVLYRDHKRAVDKVLETYDDYYEWLQSDDVTFKPKLRDIK